MPTQPTPINKSASSPDPTSRNKATRWNWEGTSKNSIKLLYTSPLQLVFQELLQNIQSLPPASIDHYLNLLSTTLLPIIHLSNSNCTNLLAGALSWKQSADATSTYFMSGSMLVDLTIPPFQPFQPIKMPKQFRQALRDHREIHEWQVFQLPWPWIWPLSFFSRTVHNLYPLPVTTLQQTTSLMKVCITYSNSSILDDWASYFRSLS